MNLSGIVIISGIGISRLNKSQQVFLSKIVAKYPQRLRHSQRNVKVRIIKPFELHEG